MSADPRLRDELEATIAARRELGHDLEPALIDSFVERIERRIDDRKRAREPSLRDRGMELALAIVSFIFAIPLLLIAGATAGFEGVAVVAGAIVLVNFFFRR